MEEHKIPRDLDRKWYEEQMRKVPVIYRQKARDGYRRVWLEAYEAEPVNHKKPNAAARAANERLRVFVTALLNNDKPKR